MGAPSLKYGPSASEVVEHCPFSRPLPSEKENPEIEVA